MQMHWIDWTIVFALLAFITIVAIYTKKYTQSIADFLAAGRCARRYLISTSDGIASLGSISIIMLFEIYYKAGFSIHWWATITTVFTIVAALSGWVVYRFRATRALTLAQFLEIRYSKNFRIFAGLLSWLCGIINFGIFPAVGGRFFIYFCGLPETVYVFGIAVPTLAPAMIILLGIALFFTLIGGQVTVIITDFLQGLFCYAVFVIIIIAALTIFNWRQIAEALQMAPPNASLMNPFHTSEATDFNIWFYLIAAFAIFYQWMAWQGNQGYNASALNPHEARMGKILGTWRGIPASLFMLFIPVCAYTLLHHPDFAAQAQSVKTFLAGIDNPAIQTQMTVPITMRCFLTTGFMGALCAVMLATFITTHDTYLHSWGSILIQDVIMPFRKKPLSPQQHFKMLRYSIFAVALFIFFFSLLFRQTDYIAMFFAITGAIYLGGAGTVIIGGLYWKRGTAAAAWTSLIAGAALAAAGILLDQIWPIMYGGDKFPINGQWKMFMISLCCIFLYVLVSLLGKKNSFNMDQMLHRNKYALNDTADTAASKPVRGLKALIGIDAQFTRVDKIIYIGTISWTLLWIIIFILGTTCALVFNIEAKAWIKYWQIYVLLHLALSVITTVWFTVGGLRDLKSMFGFLRAAKRNASDDGRVTNHHNQGESVSNQSMEADLLN